MKRIHRTIYIICFCLTMTACKKFVAISPSPQLITTDAIFTNDNTAISAVEGLYTQIRAATPAYANGGLSIYAGLSADEIYNTASSTTYDPFYQNSIPSNNSTISGTFWSGPYNIIYRANAILEGLSKTSALTAAVKNQLTGETKIVRALTYFYMVNLYGDVPLTLSSDYKQSAIMSRTPAAQVYQQMVTDLTEAQKLLMDTYPSTGKSRPNKMTATALLARVYLYQKDWPDAEAQATQVISSNLYSLAPDLNKVFLINSVETIWEIASPGETRNSAEGATYVPASITVKPAFAINPSLLNAFESGDKRKASWLNSNTVGGTVYYYPFKFKSRVTTPVTEYDVVLRLAEQYLIRAEARAEQSQSKVADAIADLNLIRTRAGLTALSAATTQAQCFSSVMQERRIELSTEWGQRWFDLKRWGNIDQVLTAEKAGWQPYTALYPIPYQQILYNGNLKQNPVYQ